VPALVPTLVPARERSQRERPQRERPQRERPQDDQIAALEEIARGRLKVAASWAELEGRLQRATSWRHWVGAHPGAWICAGLCLGFLVGGGMRRR
jgi:hypothetical protein